MKKIQKNPKKRKKKKSSSQRWEVMDPALSSLIDEFDGAHIQYSTPTASPFDSVATNPSPSPPRAYPSLKALPNPSHGVGQQKHETVVVHPTTLWSDQDVHSVDLISHWKELLLRVGIPREVAERYGEAFAKAGVDVGDGMSEEKLIELGVENQMHRNMIASAGGKVSMNLIESWRDLLYSVGIPQEFAEKYGKIFAKAGVDVGDGLSDEKLKVLGVRDDAHRRKITSAVRVSMNLIQSWRDLFSSVGIPEKVAGTYGKAFAMAGVDAESSDGLSDEKLKALGVQDEAHRNKIKSAMRAKVKDGSSTQKIADQSKTHRDTGASRDLVQKWKILLSSVGITSEYAAKYSLTFAEAGFNEENCEELLSEEKLKGLGVGNETHRRKIQSAIEGGAECDVVKPPTDRTLAQNWKDLFSRVGITPEYAWKYALKFAEAGFNEENCEKLLSDETLSSLGIDNQTHRDRIRNAIESEADSKVANWRNLFLRANLGTDWALDKALKLTQAGWDENNAMDMEEHDLQTAGIEKSADRDVILEIIDRAIREAESEAAQIVEASVTSAADFKKADKQVRRDIAKHLEAYELFEQKLAEILSGNTDTQIAAREERNVIRRLRQAQRQKKRDQLSDVRKKKSST